MKRSPRVELNVKETASNRVAVDVMKSLLAPCYIEKDVARKSKRDGREYDPDEISELIHSMIGTSNPSKDKELQILQQKYKNLKEKKNFEDRLADMMAPYVNSFSPIPPPPSVPISMGSEEIAVQLIGDWHIGEVVEASAINPMVCHRSGKMDYPPNPDVGFNLNVALRRIEHLADVGPSLVNIHRHTSTIKDMVVIGLGDYVSGTIHDELLRTEEVNVVDQVAMAAYLLSLYLGDMLRSFENITFVGVSGNHGRVPKKKEMKQSAHYNWDYVTMQLASMYFKNNPRIQFILPKSPVCIVEIMGHNYVVGHGDGIKGWSGIPFYGINRYKANWRELADAYGLENGIDGYIMGHFHQDLHIQGITDQTIINGSLKGGDEFAQQVLAVKSRPTQRIFGVNKSSEATWAYQVWLDRIQNPDQPQRYVLPESPLWADWIQ